MAALPAPYVRFSVHFMSLEFEVLPSEIHKVNYFNSVSGGIKRPIKAKKWEKTVNAVLPEGQTVTEMKRKCLDMKMASKKQSEDDGRRLHTPACEDIQPIHLTAGNNTSLN